MHIYVAGIGGAGMGPLAAIARQLGYRVSGSDTKPSSSLNELVEAGQVINIGQTASQIAATHQQFPIDWYVYSSALVNPWRPTNPELAWAQANIRTSKRDQFLNHMLAETGLKMLAISGTHGKTTTTAMIVWLLTEFQRPIGYIVGSDLFGRGAGEIDANAEWFIYEADEYDRNFLAYRPQLSLISGVDHDHYDTYPTAADYNAAFRQFIGQSKQVIAHRADIDRLYPSQSVATNITVAAEPHQDITIPGRVNHYNGQIALEAVVASGLIAGPIGPDLIGCLNRYPGAGRRFERIGANVYSDYAHTIPKISGCLARAKTLGKSISVVYEPHSDQRQRHIQTAYGAVFAPAAKLYWLPTYTARDDPDLAPLSPEALIANLDCPTTLVQAARIGPELKRSLAADIAAGAVVVAMTAASGPEHLDGWLRQEFGDSAD